MNQLIARSLGELPDNEEDNMTCQHIGSHQVDGLCAECWKERTLELEASNDRQAKGLVQLLERAEKAEAAFSAIPSTFYIGLPAEKRLKLLVEGWRNAVVVNQKLQDKLDRYSIENPTICYQCGAPDTFQVMLEALQKCLAHLSSNHELTLEYIRKALAELEKKTP